LQTGSLALVTPERGDPDESLTDAELTALALAADPHAPLPAEAVPIDVHLARFGPQLPSWYMPPVASHGPSHGRWTWKAPFVIAIISAFLLIDVMGLCNTYGILGFA
jgi:hypothetical protein